jgi:hypothetical protein
MYVHRFLSKAFNATMVRIGSKEVLVGESTTELDTKEFEEYVEIIRIWAITDLGLEIPLPNDEI